MCLPNNCSFHTALYLLLGIKHLPREQQERGKGLFSLQFKITVHYFGEDEAGTQDVSQITSVVKSKRNRNVPLLAALLHSPESLPRE